jgi:hypothetical protein
MADQSDVRRIALSLPDVEEGDTGFSFGVRRGAATKGIAWVWQERLEPKKPRVPNPDVLAVRVSGEAEKQELLSAAPDRFFTEPHYNGYPAVLVRLAAVDLEELRELLTDAWRVMAPPKLVRESGL